MHRLAASNRLASRCYLRLFSILKLFPDRGWKDQVMNSLFTVKWPLAALPPIRVERIPGMPVLLVPHPGEADFMCQIYRRIPYERGLSSWLRNRHYDAVIEIGANVGLYSVLFSRLWPEARIYSFEPSREAYGRLLRNLELNGCGNVHPFQCAVYSTSGFADFHEPDGHLTNGSLQREFATLFAEKLYTSKTLTVAGSALRDLVREGESVLVKVDVEGAEPEVARALEPLLVETQADLIIEVLDDSVDELNRIGFLKDYRLLQMARSGPVERSEFVATEVRDYAVIPIRRENAKGHAAQGSV